MTSFSYKSGGRTSRYLSDYRDLTVGDLNVSYTLDDWWEDTKQTQRIEEVTYGTVGEYGSYGIGSQVKGSGVGNDTQIATGGIFVVGSRGRFLIGGAATTFTKSQPVTSIVCSGGVCVYSYEAGNISETVGQHGPSVINAGIGARRIDSFQFVFDVWQPISRFVGAAECRVYNYEPDYTEDYNELDYGLITANATITNDYGSVAEEHGSGEENYGHILDGFVTRFGFKKIIGEAQARATNSWVGSGRLKKFGAQVSPAIYGYIVDGKVRSFHISGTGGESIPRFYFSEGGTLHLDGNGIPVITAITSGDGNLRKFGGSAESSTFNPDEKQMLFSFVGGITAEKHTETYIGSGRLKNFAKVEGVKNTFDYTGSGGVLKLKPRKPVTYELGELANLTLEIDQALGKYWRDPGDNTNRWNATTKVGTVLLKQFNETSHEKHTDVFSQTAFVPYKDVDYGFLINQNVSNCTAVSGTISTNTTASTGCTKVAPGTTLAIAPGVTYGIPTVQTTPSDYIDYGNVAEAAAPRIDHGWILGERSDLRRPYGLGLRFTSQVEVIPLRVYDWTSTGEPPIFKILGDTTLPLDVSEEGGGILFTAGGAAETTSAALGADGLFRFLSLTTTTRARDFVGSGSLKKFSGAAESLTFNPTEEQILFSFAGLGKESSTFREIGSGRLSTLSGAAESIRWSAQHTTGLYRISGVLVEKHTESYVGSGSLKKFSGAAESLTFNPEEKQMLFSFTGGAVVRNTYEYTGSGLLRNFAKVEDVKQTFDYVGSGTLNVNPRKPQTYELSELGAFTLDFYSLYNAYINLGNIDFYNQANTNLGPVQLKWLNLEESHEKHTEAYNNSACVDDVDLDYGNLVNQNLTNCVQNSGTISTNTTAANGCIKVAPNTTLAIAPGATYTIPNQLTTPSVTEDYGLVSEANAPERRDYGHILGTRSKKCPFGAFKITGVAKTHFVENIVSTGLSVSGKSGITLFGEAKTFWTPPYLADGLSNITGTATESYTPAPHIGSGVLYAFSGAAESTSIGAVSGGLFKFGSEGYTLFSLLHPGSGIITVSGTKQESFTPASHVGSGSLRKFSGAAESATFNPLERQMLFSFTGVGAEVFVANPPEKGTEIRLSGSTAPEILTFAEQPEIRIAISGVADTDRSRTFVGSGTFKKFSGAAESITFNPEEKQMLFSFTGSGTEVFSANPPEEVAELRLRGTTEPEILAFAEQPEVRVAISGDVFARATLRHIGSGSLRKFSGAAESLTFNPEERQLLFSFTGTGSERTVAVPPEGDGRLFSFNSATVVSAAAYETTGLFTVSGISLNVRSVSHVGSGTFKKFSGAAEALTFNPEERQMLFSFTGQGSDAVTSVEVGSGGLKIYPEASDIRFVPNWNTSGGIKVRVYAEYRFAPVWIGSGSLKKFSGAAESLTVNPTEEQMLFSFTGQGSESRLAREISKGGTVKLSGDARIVLVPNNIGSGTIFVTGDANAVRARDFAGSGSLRKLSGAAESRAIDITTLPSLFRVYGDGDIARSRPYIGSGSLRKLSGAAESITVNPDEKQMLFSILGQATTTRARDKVGQGTVRTLGDSVARFSPVYIGSGTARVSGDATVVRARDFVGFGSLRKLSGAAESLTFNPTEEQMLFSFTGQGQQRRASKLISAGGTLAIRGTSGDPLLTFAEQPRVEIDITGDSIDLRTRSYQGSGRISNVNNADDAYVRAPYQGSGTIRLSGVALVQVQLFQPPFTQVWII